ncbi:hypothetical protein ACYSNU_01295 [Enterococcus sp. LJL120]
MTTKQDLLMSFKLIKEADLATLQDLALNATEPEERSFFLDFFNKNYKNSKKKSLKKEILYYEKVK